MDKELYPKKLIVVKKICRVDLFIKKIEKICRCRAEYLESKHVIANWSYIQATATLWIRSAYFLFHPSVY